MLERPVSKEVLKLQLEITALNRKFVNQQEQLNETLKELNTIKGNPVREVLAKRKIVHFETEHSATREKTSHLAMECATGSKDRHQLELEAAHLIISHRNDELNLSYRRINEILQSSTDKGNQIASLQRTNRVLNLAIIALLLVIAITLAI